MKQGQEHRPAALAVALSVQAGAGGPARSILRLSEHLARAGWRVDLCAAAFPAFGCRVDFDATLVRLHEARGWIWPAPRLFLAPGLRRLVDRCAETADVVHSSGVLVPLTSNSAAVAARRRGIPHVVSPRGMLHPVALRRSRWKKAIASALGGRRDLSEVACFHALTEDEAAYIRQAGLRNPVAVIPNGVDLEEFAHLPDPAEFRERCPEVAGRRLAVYLGRIHPIKGLPNLVAAWAEAAGRLADWRLILAGPDEVGQRAELEAAARRLGIQDRLSFVGPLYGRDKLLLLGASEAFVLPSLSEGFSVSVLEAMACGLPVLLSPQCHFPEAAECGAGAVSPAEPSALAAALVSLLSREPEDLKAMGRRGRRLVEERYGWHAIASQMGQVYEWVCGWGGRPACVREG